MDLALILFILRLISAALLMTLLGALFVVLWRDYSSAANHADVQRRVYGQLIRLIQVDDMFAPTGDTYPLRPLTSIGRAPTNAIVIKDDFSSSEHALVSLKNGRWWLEDRNSRNGTLLNGETVSTPTIVTDSDIVSIGNSHFKLSFDH
ncbi:MAG: FHA domain-containing protein [Phototrophicaceae bacterium]